MLSIIKLGEKRKLNKSIDNVKFHVPNDQMTHSFHSTINQHKKNNRLSRRIYFAVILFLLQNNNRLVKNSFVFLYRVIHAIITTMFDICP